LSNALLRAVHRVKGLPPMARQVLTVLADEARDSQGGRSSLTTGQIADRTGLSRRTIHRAYVILTEAGHITREETAPGAPFVTLVHPFLGERAAAAASNLTPATVSEGAATVSAPPCQPVRGSNIIEEPVTISPRARAQDLPDQEKVSDPVEQVFDAWDGWTRRAGLPGPIQRDAARRVAVAHKLAAVGLGQVMMTIGTVERGVAAGGFRRKGAVAGQGDLFCTFDAVFEVGHAAALRLFTRLLDGEFGRPAEREAVATERLNGGRSVDPDEPPRCQVIRASLRERLGVQICKAWVDPLRLEQAGGELLAIAPSAFHADYLATNYAAELRRAAGGPVRITVRETV
jgi:DNA-binding transcriptional regulator YhcF (GntR family)